MNALLQTLDGIDYQAALSYCMGDEAVLLNALKTYATTIPDKAKKIASLWQSQDIRNYTIEVHSIKSSSRAIGASVLSKLAEHLEHCGDQNNIEEINKKTPELLDLYTSYTAKLAPLFEKKETTNASSKPSISEDDINGAWVAIKELVQVFDYPRATEVLHMLNDYQLTEAQQQKYDAVEKLLRVVDQEGLLSIL
ncbi:MAG: Hpt domain-containing protein [Treponema sp.]|nr:Hpt domain-containing protein [Treponema sp.]